ncbi:nuclear transport factor 2 family protein [Leptospira sp. WS58.C1]|uniref:nuclear transport factor 2 family protein n=1 Tax=Leptospira cinconiae TaxID=3235173 RepID=UPI00349E86A5
MNTLEKEWLENFIRFWAAPQSRFELLRSLFAENIKLIAPGTPTVRGLRRALMLFEKTFQEMPDLHATIHRYAFRDDILFIEMTFMATIAGESFAWDNIDRFLLANGKALERKAFFDPTELQRRIGNHSK